MDIIINFVTLCLLCKLQTNLPVYIRYCPYIAKNLQELLKSLFIYLISDHCGGDGGVLTLTIYST